MNSIVFLYIATFLLMDKLHVIATFDEFSVFLTSSNLHLRGFFAQNPYSLLFI